MKQIAGLGAFSGIAFALLLFHPALAAPRAQLLSAANGLPLEKISVFCGAMGCQPITKVKKCAPDNHNHVAAAGQREVIVRRTCNFL